MEQPEYKIASSVLPSTIHFGHTQGNDSTEVLRISKEGIWANPDVPVDEAARLVLDAIGNGIRLMVEQAVKAERAAMMKLFTDPENQPTQHGTVTVEYMQREIAAAVAAERERFALECIDLVALHGGPVDLEAAIRARWQA